jgi:hypothetical protein
MKENTSAVCGTFVLRKLSLIQFHGIAEKAKKITAEKAF